MKMGCCSIFKFKGHVDVRIEKNGDIGTFLQQQLSCEQLLIFIQE